MSMGTGSGDLRLRRVSSWVDFTLDASNFGAQDISNVTASGMCINWYCWRLQCFQVAQLEAVTIDGAAATTADVSLGTFHSFRMRLLSLWALAI